MLGALTAVVFVVGLTLEIGAVLAFALWWKQRDAARASRKRFEAAKTANEPGEVEEPPAPPSWRSPPALLGTLLTVLAHALVFLFAYHLGGA